MPEQDVLLNEKVGNIKQGLKMLSQTTQNSQFKLRKNQQNNASAQENVLANQIVDTKTRMQITQSVENPMDGMDSMEQLS